jgi:PKHD-type hydroxylase
MLITIPSLLDDKALKEMAPLLSRGRWQEGKLSAGSQAAQVKNNLQLEDGDEQTQQLSQFVQQHLERHPLFISAALPKQIYPPKFNCYKDGGHYGLHIDSAILSRTNAPAMRSDISATVFLSSPDSYEGGELEIETAFGVQHVKLQAGDAVLYPSSSLHQVQPVTRGQRVCAFLWVQSLIADSAHREMLYELDQSVQTLTLERGSNDHEVKRLTGLYHNLLRTWAKL